MDGKHPNHGSGASILTAVSVPSQHYLGSALVDTKTNEIPVAQQHLIPHLDLQGRFLSLDALHTQDQTARAVVLEAGADYLLRCKLNQPTLWDIDCLRGRAFRRSSLLQSEQMVYRIRAILCPLCALGALCGPIGERDSIGSGRPGGDRGNRGHRVG
jgi:hypothetical protein